MAMNRCWLVSRQWSLPLRLAWRSSVPQPVAKLSSLWQVPKCTGKKQQQQQQLAVGLPPSFHTASIYLLKDEDTIDPSTTSDSDVSTGESPAGRVSGVLLVVSPSQTLYQSQCRKGSGQLT